VHRIKVIQAICITVSFVLLISGGYAAYNKSKTLNESICLGCIGLNPIVESFSEFWVEYPRGYGKEGNVSHPQWVIDELNKGKIVMLFFWYHGCEPCSRQWNDMLHAGIVEGTEENGKIGVAYKNNVTLLTIDTINSERKDSIKLYNPSKKEDYNPTTAIITMKNGSILWYAFQGPADGSGGRPSMRGLEEILNYALKIKEDG